MRSRSVVAGRGGGQVHRLSAESALTKVDWDFSDAWTRYGLNLTHWYPTRLAPQVASTLISQLTKKGDVVCDPFCGSGTVLAEAMRLGRSSVGIDISPVACMIARARTTLIPVSKLSTAVGAFLERVRFGLDMLDQSALPLPGTAAEQESLALVRSRWGRIHSAELSKWFHPRVYRDICFVTECIAAESDERVRVLLTTTLSSLLRTCCSQPRSWGYIADNVLPKEYRYRDIYALLGRRIRALIIGMQMAIEQCASVELSVQEANALTTVVLGDARNAEILAPETVDCVVTSPPYANVSDNVTSQRLSLLWLGHNTNSIKQMEIGARWKRFRKDSLKTYVGEMQEALLRISGSLKDGGSLALILGSSPQREKSHSILPTIVTYITDTLRMKEIAQFSRKLSTTRQHGSYGVFQENIFIFRKT